MATTLTGRHADAKAGGRKQFTSRTVAIGAGKSVSVGLGAFGHAAPAPSFRVTSQPDIGTALQAELENLHVPGEPTYMLMYRLRNNSDRDCQVVVVRGGDGE